MSQARRDRFEQQLRSLQTDISKLSKRIVYSAGPNAQLNAVSISEPVDEIVDAGTDKGLIIRLKRELRLVTRERDDAIFKFEQMKREMEHLQASGKESVQLKFMYDTLKQEYESIKVSFESSERIRRQQKDLISLLQQSHTVSMADNASVRSSISSILEPPSLSPSAVAAENRSWLNSFVSTSRSKPSFNLNGSFDRSVLKNPKKFSFIQGSNNSTVDLDKTSPRPVVRVSNARTEMNRARPPAPALQGKAAGSTTPTAAIQKKRGVIARSRSQSELSGADGGGDYAARRRINTNSSVASAPVTNGAVEFGRPPTYPVGNSSFGALESPGEPGPGQSSILSQYLSSAPSVAAAVEPRPRDGDRMYSTYASTAWESAAVSGNHGGNAGSRNDDRESRGGEAVLHSNRPMSAPPGTQSRRRFGSGLSDGFRDSRDTALTLKQQRRVGNKLKQSKSAGIGGLSQGARRLSQASD